MQQPPTATTPSEPHTGVQAHAVLRWPSNEQYTARQAIAIMAAAVCARRLGGAHGTDPWLFKLHELLVAEPVPVELDQALAPLTAVGVDVAAVHKAIARHASAPRTTWHPDDWRHSHPEFPAKYALAIHVYTLQDPNVYKPLGEAMHTDARAIGPSGVSSAFRAVLPFAKLLDVGLREAARVWGCFIGQVFRGVKYAFPRPTAAEHDPERHFAPGRELYWFEFNSSATHFDVMYEAWFCGKSGPRTVFTIQSCEGVSIKKFSIMPDEDEVLFRPLAHFRVTSSSKRLHVTDLGHCPPTDGGFPDDVQLQQLPSVGINTYAHEQSIQLRVPASAPPASSLRGHVQIKMRGKKRCRCVVVACALVAFLAGALAFRAIQTQQSTPSQVNITQGIETLESGPGLGLGPVAVPSPSPPPPSPSPPPPTPPSPIPPPPPPVLSTGRPSEGAGACCSNCFPYRHACDNCKAGCTSTYPVLDLLDTIALG
jgi:hypothetical protein